MTPSCITAERIASLVCSNMPGVQSANEEAATKREDRIKRLRMGSFGNWYAPNDTRVYRPSHHQVSAALALAPRVNGPHALESARQFQSALRALADVRREIVALEIRVALAGVHHQRPFVRHHRRPD